MSKPAFVLVPGAWQDPSYYGAVATGLKYHGYDSVTVTLPSTGASPPLYDFTEDVTAVRQAVTKFVENDRDVVVVAHSYSGLPTGELPKSLSKEDREANGLKGGVIRMVFIVAYLVPEGFQAAPRGDISTFFTFMESDLEVRTYLPLPVAFAC